MRGWEIEEIGGSYRGMYLCNTGDIPKLSEIIIRGTYNG